MGTMAINAVFFITFISNADLPRDKALKLFDIAADAFVLNGDVEKAIPLLSEAIELDPQLADAYRYRAYCWAKKRELKRALADIEVARQLDPANVRVHQACGAIYVDCGDYDRAIESYTATIKKFPKSGSSYASRATCFREQKKFDEALADMNRALELAKDSEDREFTICMRGAVYFAKRDYPAAIKDLSESLRLNPKAIRSARLRGECYQALGEHQNAADDFTAYIEREPVEPEVYELRAKSYRKLDKEKEAAYDEALAKVLKTHDKKGNKIVAPPAEELPKE